MQRVFRGATITRGLRTAFTSIKSMKIDRMKEGQLYEIKPQTIIETQKVSVHKDAPELLAMRGWRQWDYNKVRPPFLYLGWKMEDWTYTYLHTNKIHYILWKEDIYVMDNQFAKHIIPVWDGEKDNGED